MVDQERAEQQWPGRNDRHLLPWMAGHPGAAGAASRAEGRMRAGLSRRHVHQRRFPPQWSVSPQLWLRILGAARNYEGKEHQLRVRPVRYLLVVLESGRAFQREC